MRNLFRKLFRKDYQTLIELETQLNVVFPREARELVNKLCNLNSILLFNAYNYQEFALIGPHLLNTKNKEQLESIKIMLNQYKEISSFVPIGYNSIDYYYSCLLLKKNGTELFYFAGMESNTHYLIQTKLKLSDLIPHNWEDYKTQNNYSVDLCKDEYKQIVPDHVILGDGSSSDEELTIDLTPFLEKFDYKLELKNNQTNEGEFYLDGINIYTNKFSRAHFDHQEFLDVLNQKLDNFIIFKVFLNNYEGECSALGKVLNEETPLELKRKGYIKQKLVIE